MPSLGTFGCSVPGLRTSAREWVGHVETHRPQPMQRSRFSSTFSAFKLNAPIWHRVVQVPQPPQDSGLSVRLSFDNPVQGPLALGYASHFGLGLFAAEEI